MDIRIIIVDDEIWVTTGLRKMLENKGYIVRTFNTTEEALQYVHEGGEVDIVISDINMPGSNGLDMCEQIRLLQDVEIVIISGYDQFEYAKRGINLRVADYILKPINQKSFLGTIEELSHKIEEKKKKNSGEVQYVPVSRYYSHVTSISRKIESGDKDVTMETEALFDELESTCSDPDQIRKICANIIMLIYYECSHWLSNTVEKEEFREAFIWGKGGAVEIKRRFLNELNKLLDEKKEMKGSKTTNLLDAVLHLLEKDCSQVTMLQAAEYVGISPAYFSHIFKEQTGENFKDYLIDYKMKHAANQLVNSGKKISIVAKEVGYSDVDHFARVFRKKYNMTPSEYRIIQHAK